MWEDISLISNGECYPEQFHIISSWAFSGEPIVIINRKSRKFVKKKRIYLKMEGRLFPWFWIEFLEDKSFSLGMSSSATTFTEYGSAIWRKQTFEEHIPILTSGNVPIKEAHSLHVTFHPPRITQKQGVVHMTAANGRVDEWNMDWFPVGNPKLIVTLLSGDIEQLGSAGRTKRNYSVVTVAPGIRRVRMDMYICPNPPNITLDPKAFDNVLGWSPAYVLCCSFYQDSRQQAALYVASGHRLVADRDTSRKGRPNDP